MGCAASTPAAAAESKPAENQPEAKKEEAAAPAALPTDQTYAMIKPGNEANWGNAIAAIIAAGFTIEAAKVITMDTNLVSTFYAEHIGKSFFDTLSAYMTSGPALALHLRREDAVVTWRTLIGPTNLEKAKAEAPNSLRALYGRSGTENFAHGSDAHASAARELQIIFGQLTAVVSAEASAPNAERTYAMIKPGFVGRWGDVLTRVIAEGFTIVQIRRTAFQQKDIDAFYAEHIGKPFFETLATYMTSGPIVGLCLERENAIAHWRTVLGPTNLEKAKAEAPNSLRALYAKSTTENLCHGSDAKASAAREISLIFGSEPIGCRDNNNNKNNLASNM